ncbi:DUF4031 domain-containing protein [Pseudactinotalea sp. Z1732]|uniref:DUF4031 domain-containing protein n=1 Tax=Pseudactinotalea sp. Z1732 TaxID=3413026 RepID=UPI003C7B648A
MAILIDPPTWPAHGTVFAHLVSDQSLEELHDFATRAGLPEQAFDMDHYDVPAHRYDDLVARGAIAVSGRELIRRLRNSGLRIPARDRPETLRRVLSAFWGSTVERWQDRPDDDVTHRGASGPVPAAVALGADLIERWAQPHRRYHDLRHLRDVLAALDLLCDPDPAPLPVVLAAWFHDAVYDGVPGEDEQASADLARAELGPEALGPEALPSDRIEEVARLVLLTRTHSPEPGDHHGALLCDADLAVLAREATGYRRYARDVRAEYSHVPHADFIKGRTAVVRHLLELEPLYRTDRGRELWQEAARANLRAELATLTSTP